MDVPCSELRLVVAQDSYITASRFVQTLLLAGYQHQNIFKVIETNQLLQLLQESASIHVAIIPPAILSQLEEMQLQQPVRTLFADVALLLFGDGEAHDRTWQGKDKIMPDETLPPPVTAETLENSIRTALERHANRHRAQRYISQVATAMKHGSAAEAQANFAKAIHVDAHDPYSCYMLGELFESMGQQDQALTAYAHGWKRKPSCVSGLKRIVDLLFASGKETAAIPYLESAMQQSTTPIEARLILGVLYLEEGLLEQAGETIRSAGHQDANRSMVLLLEHAHDLRQRQGVVATTRLLQIGREIQPENAQLYGMLGDLYTQQEQHREALSCYELQLRLGQPGPQSYCRLAQTYLTLGYPLRAEKALQEALKIDPDFEEAIQLRDVVVG